MNGKFVKAGQWDIRNFVWRLFASRRTRLLRVLSIAALYAGLLSAPPLAHAQPSSYPAKLIKIIAPSPPGSPPDLIARTLGESLARIFAQPVIVENRAGAGQTIGLNALAKSPPDGYTLGIITLTGLLSPSLIAAMPYDTTKDLAPVSLLQWEYHILAVPAGSSARSLADLVASAKARPGMLKFSSGGNGTPAHLGGELLKRDAGVDIVHIPYKGAPAGTPAPIIARLQSEIAKVLAMPEVMERIDSLGGMPAKMGPAEFGTFIRSELQRWGKVVREAGIKAD